MRDLPEILPLFPLDGVILLPGSTLPLNVFEPRYRQLVRDVMESHRLIGLIQPRESPREGHQPALYETGCAGRITALHETDDGRFLITLGGIIRFILCEEVMGDAPYRRAIVAYDGFVADRQSPKALDESARGDLIAVLLPYLDIIKADIDHDVIRRLGDEALVNAISQLCPFEPAEKQALLEARTLEDRCRLAGELLKFAIAGPIAPGNNGLIQ